MKKSTIVLIVVGGVIVIGGLWFWATHEPKSSPISQSTPEQSTSAPDLQLVKSSLVQEYSCWCVAGEVKNTTFHNLSNVYINFNFYDESGAQVGEGNASCSELEAGGVWKFITASTVACSEHDVKSYKLIDLHSH